jgi:hypothetical protein
MSKPKYCGQNTGKLWVNNRRIGQKVPLLTLFVEDADSLSACYEMGSAQEKMWQVYIRQKLANSPSKVMCELCYVQDIVSDTEYSILESTESAKFTTPDEIYVSPDDNCLEEYDVLLANGVKGMIHSDMANQVFQ